MRWVCCREGPILTLFWNSFFDLLFVAFVIMIMYKGLLQKTLSLWPTVQVPLFGTLQKGKS